MSSSRSAACQRAPVFAAPADSKAPEALVELVELAKGLWPAAA